jgi:hypothetical protein
LRPGALRVVMVMVVFHNCEFDGFLCLNSFAQHLWATKKTTMAPKRPPPPRRYIRE